MNADGVQQPRSRYRLLLMIWFSLLVAGGLFLYGWTAYYKVHWVVRILGTSLIGFGAFFVIVNFLYSIVTASILLLICFDLDTYTTVPNRCLRVWLRLRHQPSELTTYFGTISAYSYPLSDPQCTAVRTIGGEIPYWGS